MRTPQTQLVDVETFRARWFDEAVEIYLRAMDAPASYLPHRRELFRSHLAEPGWAAAVAEPPPAGFCYGFHLGPGQWWHDNVHIGLSAVHGPAVANRWLDDAFCLAELHVRPEWQRGGIGRALVATLLRDRPERTVLLSARRDSTDARGFYTAVGFTELLDDCSFTGTDRYAILGRQPR